MTGGIERAGWDTRRGEEGRSRTRRLFLHCCPVRIGRKLLAVDKLAVDEKVLP